MQETNVQQHVEWQKPQTLRGLFDQVTSNWKDQGPTQGHIRPLEKGGPFLQLQLHKTVAANDKKTVYTLDEFNRAAEERRQIELTIGDDGSETIKYRESDRYSPELVEKQLSAEGMAKLTHDVIARSRWGREQKFNPYGYLDMEQISQGKLFKELGLLGYDIPPEVFESVQKSQWFTIDNGRVVVEIRNPDVLSTTRTGGMRISDADDTIFSATNWHKQEYEQLATSKELQARNIHITADQAKQIYEMSKITVKGKAEKEPRYTPRLNIALLSLYGRAMEFGGKTSQPGI